MADSPTVRGQRWRRPSEEERAAHLEALEMLARLLAQPRKAIPATFVLLRANA